MILLAFSIIFPHSLSDLPVFFYVLGVSQAVEVVSLSESGQGNGEESVGKPNINYFCICMFSRFRKKPEPKKYNEFDDDDEYADDMQLGLPLNTLAVRNSSNGNLLPTL